MSSASCTLRFRDLRRDRFSFVVTASRTLSTRVTACDEGAPWRAPRHAAPPPHRHASAWTYTAARGTHMDVSQPNRHTCTHAKGTRHGNGRATVACRGWWGDATRHGRASARTTGIWTGAVAGHGHSTTAPHWLHYRDATEPTCFGTVAMINPNPGATGPSRVGRTHRWLGPKPEPGWACFAVILSHGRRLLGLL